MITYFLDTLIVRRRANGEVCQIWGNLHIVSRRLGIVSGLLRTVLASSSHSRQAWSIACAEPSLFRCKLIHDVNSEACYPCNDYPLQNCFNIHYPASFPGIIFRTRGIKIAAPINKTTTGIHSTICSYQAFCVPKSLVTKLLLTIYVKAVG